MTPIMNDYLEVEPLIIARLKEELSDVQILSSWGQPVIKESPELPPSVMLFLEDDQPAEAVAAGKNQKIEQRWLALVVVREPEQEAGPLIARVIRSLAGWRPEGGRFAPFQRIRTSFLPDFSPNGFFYFPLSFTTTFVFNSES